ncbi:hypothetical protein [Flavobacterium sp. HNIBRBA15423]|uniref:hypothetical protein n=1 Tax=Flavobacterium sp. HNIBRBA15423 TaxID=3458683 RepID=UPI004043F086
MKDNNRQLVTEIEGLLKQELDKQTQTIVSVILGWNPDFTEIRFWFESNWNDYSNPYYETPAFIFPCLTFATLIDDIAIGKVTEIEYDFNDEAVSFKNFGNLLNFNDFAKNELALKAINLAKASLIEITKQLGKQQNLLQQEQLVSFKVADIESGSHATLTAVYSPFTQNKLFKTVIEHIESRKKIKGYVALTDEEILFFRVDDADKSEWETVFKNESSVIHLKMENVIDFGLKIEYGNFKLLATDKNVGTISLSLSYEIDKAFDGKTITSLFLDVIRKNSKAIENEVIRVLTGPEKKMKNRKEEDIHPNDRVIVQMAKKVPLETKPLAFLPYLEQNLNKETPKYWNVTDSDTHKELGTSLLFFKQNDKIYNFTNQGLLVAFSIENDQIEIISQKEIVTSPNCACYYENKLYIAHNETEIVVYTIQEETISVIEINENDFDSDIDHIFVNEDYMTLCSIAGLALYKKKEPHFEFLELVTVGSTQLLYTYAKQALIHNDYLYITAGNTGLVTYKLYPNEKTTLLQVLSPECEHPFCDNINLVDTNLVIQMEGNHWLIDISNPEKPKSSALFISGPEKEKIGPFLLDNQFFFMDGNKPLVWSYSLNSSKEVEVLCEHITKNGEDAYFYYPKNLYLEGNSLLFSGNYGYSLLKRESTRKTDYTPFREIESKEEALYHLMEEELDTYFENNKENLVGKLEIEPRESGFTLCAYAPDYLIKSIGYSQNQLLTKDFSWLDIDLKIGEPGYTYYAIYNKELSKTQYNLIRKIALRFFQSSKSYWNKTVFFTYNGYYERVDRNVVIVEYVKQN